MILVRKTLYIALAFISLCACASRNEMSITRNRPAAFYEKGTNRVYRRSGDYSLKTPDSSEPMPSETEEKRAEKLAEAITKLEGIKKATVVITGSTALVGIETNKAIEDAELIDIKRLVEEQISIVDKAIDHISVTTSEDLVHRISRMSDAGISEKPPEESRDFVPEG
jgi:YhcN/YlaJ family sporulation lipoprotein